MLIERKNHFRARVCVTLILDFIWNILLELKIAVALYFFIEHQSTLDTESKSNVIVLVINSILLSS